ncbi:MAG: peroxide stress protein YaaA [Halobacteriovorax sp.]|nr:peroxide stress protein YaaA [Halobacteriovorax sp.]|tara:strand:+ start:2971 stop:3729 length:759 start_codon:yes stop_codon:yes gene_type:complete
MLVVVSPAKKLDFENPAPTKKFTQLTELERSKILIEKLKKTDAKTIANMMKLSDSLTELNIKRYKEFKTPFNLKNAKQAMFAFKGDTYVGLNAETMKEDDIEYAQDHLRILSGLYGLVSPLDLVQPYRLEMGTKFSADGSKNLYDFWSDSITGKLNKLLEKEETLVNLASKEYFTAINFKKLDGKVITPIFKEKKGDDFKIVSFFAKKARGMMSRYIIDNRIENAKDLSDFDVDGYKFNKKFSTELEPVFTR